MKSKSARPVVIAAPSEEAIRDYAYHLYQQGNCVPGHDLDDWLAAEAFLSANNPPQRNGTHHNQPIKGPGHDRASVLPSQGAFLLA